MATVDRDALADDQRRRGRQVATAEGLLVPVLAAGERRLVTRGNDERDSPMAEPGEVGHDLRGGARPIDPHRRDVAATDLAVEEHHRHAGPSAEGRQLVGPAPRRAEDQAVGAALERSEEHTSELQSRSDLVCRPLLEKKNYE